MIRIASLVLAACLWPTPDAAAQDTAVEPCHAATHSAKKYLALDSKGTTATPSKEVDAYVDYDGGYAPGEDVAHVVKSAHIISCRPERGTAEVDVSYLVAGELAPGGKSGEGVKFTAYQPPRPLKTTWVLRRAGARWKITANSLHGPYPTVDAAIGRLEKSKQAPEVSAEGRTKHEEALKALRAAR